MSRPLPDLAVRNRAATDFDVNLVVRAGAGTGKTSLLVERILNAVGTGRVEIGSLAAITFTDKAAGEMRQRLARGLDRLRALAQGEGGDPRDDEAERAFAHLTDGLGVDRGRLAARALEAMEGLDQATVTTIHGFCSQLLRAHPVEAGVDPEFSVDSGEQAAAWRRASWERYLARELGPGAERPEIWRELLDLLPLQVVGDLAASLADFDTPETLLEPPYPLPQADELLAPDARDAVEKIGVIVETETGLTPLAKGVFEQMRDLLAALAGGGSTAFRERLRPNASLLQRLDSNKSLTPSKDIHDPQAFKRGHSVGKRLIQAARSVDDDATRLLLSAVGPFVLEFRESFLARGFISFDGLLVLTRDLLRDHPAVRDAFKRNISMLLLDEFQDTDPLQYEIMLFLAEPAGDRSEDAFQARLDPGRLFIVGDAKQSVYRFRGADYAAYRRAVDRIVETGGEALELTANFRSVGGVLDPVNRLFAADPGPWTASDYQPGYIPVHAVRQADGDGPCVELWTPDLEPRTTAALRREAEGRLIADEIERWVAAGHGRYEEVTLLLRAFTHLGQYLRPLRQRGIPFVVDGGREFLTRPEVGQLIATLRTLSQPWDPAALLAFLRSPPGGVTDTELADHAAAGGGWDWRRGELPAVAPQIAASYEMLRALARETRDMPADAVVRVTIERMRLMPLGAAAFEGAQRVANLRKLASAAGELARDGKLSLAEVVEALEKGRMPDIEMDSPLADDAAEAVRITSIHRMKGLENRRVFVGDLAKADYRPRFDDSGTQVVTLPDGRRGLAVQAGAFCNAGHVWRAGEQQRHEEAEETRVLYVGLTRARDSLTLLTTRGKSSARFIRALSAWGFDPEQPPEDGATLVDGAVRHRLVAAPSRAVAAVSEPDAGVDLARARYADAVSGLAEAAAPFATPSGRPGDLPAENDRSRRQPAGPERGGGELGRAVGRVVHGWLEGWDGREARPGSERFETLVGRNAEPAGVDREALRLEAAAILDAFEDSRLVERFRRIEILGREVPLLLRDDDGAAYRGSIDLLYRDESGALVVADYKTDRNADESALREHYRPQLDIYSRAVQRAFRELFPPRAELWLLRNGRRLAMDG